MTQWCNVTDLKIIYIYRYILCNDFKLLYAVFDKEHVEYEKVVFEFAFFLLKANYCDDLRRQGI